jgi:hypothetical protein
LILLEVDLSRIQMPWYFYLFIYFLSLFISFLLQFFLTSCNSLYLFVFLSVPLLPFFCYILVLILYLPSLLLHVSLFIYFLLFLFCTRLYFFLRHVLIFLFTPLFVTFLRNIRRARLKTSARNKHVYCDIGYPCSGTCLPFSLFYRSSPFSNAAVLAISSSSAASNIRKI